MKEFSVNLQIQNNFGSDLSEIRLCWENFNGCNTKPWRDGIPENGVTSPVVVDYNPPIGTTWWIQVIDSNGRVWTSDPENNNSYSFYEFNLKPKDHETTLTFTVSQEEFYLVRHQKEATIPMRYQIDSPPHPC